MRVVEVDPCVGCLAVLHFHKRATVVHRLTSSGRYVAQRAQVSSARTPANYHMAFTSSQQLLDVEVEIGKRGQIELEN